MPQAPCALRPELPASYPLWAGTDARLPKVMLQSPRSMARTQRPATFRTRCSFRNLVLSEFQLDWPRWLSSTEPTIRPDLPSRRTSDNHRGGAPQDRLVLNLPLARPT